MKQLLENAQGVLNNAIDLWIKKGKLSWSTELADAAVYIMEGGKAARPTLLMWSALCSAQTENENIKDNSQLQKSIETSCLEALLALEMVHVYSLVHDDLPAMDNDDYRRGKLTLHKKHNEAFAVLTGDALLTGAFEVLSHANCSDQARVLLIRELSMAAGGAGMVCGQLWDIEAEKSKSIDLDLWTKIHDAKTGALFGAALSMGAILGGDCFSENDIRDYREWGVRLGRLFQIVDDRLDKGPFYKNLGEEALLKLCEKEADQLKKSAHKIWTNPQHLDSILDFFVNRDA